MSFPALTIPFSHIFLWVASCIAEADAIIADGAKTFLATETVIFINRPANLPNKAPRNSPD